MLQVSELKKILETIDETTPVIFESKTPDGHADASYGVDKVEERTGFLVLISYDED